MCGIAGIVHRAGAPPVSPEVVRRMCEALHHRGPDDQGLYVEGGVGLGVRRLSIIDLAGGRQPIFNEDRSKVIVFNGEIYNYRDLRPQLVDRGHSLQSSSDTETILHLYEDHGPACVDRLRGMFAFAIWDAAAECLLLARDRFGIKPLYVATGPWGIAFASELKALVAVGLSARQLDWEALDAYLQLGYIPAPATPFRDVRKLEPGHILLWRRSGELTVRRYWDLPQASRSEPQPVERQLLEWFDESVAAHLVSDVPVAAFLSGGLDSSAVVSSMALMDGSPHAFTARYFGSGAPAADETPLASELANRYGARLTLVDIWPDVRDNLEPIAWALDEPHADDSALPTWLLSKHVGAVYKVVLTGIGGDELFAGYRRHIGALLGGYYARLPRSLQRAASGLANQLREPSGATLGINRLKRFLSPTANAFADRFLGYVTRAANGDRIRLYNPGLREHITRNWAQLRFETLYRDGGSPTGLRGGLYLDYKTFLPDDILALSDRLSMAHSLEVRVPFVDHVLVERVFGLPDRLKIGWWQNKQLLKRALRTRLPREHLRAPKRGFVGPTSAWLRNELRGVLQDELAPGRLNRLGYFEPGAIQKLLEEHLSRRHNREGILWALLCFSTWHRLYAEDHSVRPYHATRP
ncbi:MAG: asparagine synthase (glutamine-hydrolyzing) [Gemmatimonadetes bacterium]|nr:MAG: asparagine synthase (glutamine-hydrolyzing) [Gemmatimonadota bacterium]